MDTGKTRPLLSVVIPTKNRQTYLKLLLKELLDTVSYRFELIIQDNSDDNSLGAWISDIGDERVRYSHIQNSISVVDNCDLAIKRSSGKYVCMLGDDDGIFLTEALACLVEAAKDNIDAVMGPVLNYVWPDLKHPIYADYGGKLNLKPVKGLNRNENIASIKRSVLRHGGAFGLEDLPCVYHGFISRRILQRVFDATGSFFPGPSPDMANAIALCSVIERLRRVDKVLVISGHSVASTAGAGTQRRHHGSIAEQKHLPNDTEASWVEKVPVFWSGPTIYAQSLICAMQRTRQTDAYSLAAVYAACFIFHTEYSAETVRAMRANPERGPIMLIKILFFCALIFGRRAGNLTSRISWKLFHKGRRYVRANSISDAIKFWRARQRQEA